MNIALIAIRTKVKGFGVAFYRRKLTIGTDVRILIGTLSIWAVK